MERLLNGVAAMVVCGALAFAIVLFGAVHAWFAAPVWAAGLVVLALLAASLLLGPGFTRALWVDAAVLLFLAVALLNWARSPDEFQSRLEVLNLVTCAAFYLGVRFLLQRNWHLHLVVATFLLVALAASALAVYQHFAEVKMVLWRPQVYAGRSSGTHICPNHYAGLMALAMPLALGLLLWSHLHAAWRILLGYGFAVMFAGLFFSFSRAGQAAVAIGLAAALWLGLRRKGLATLLVGLGFSLCAISVVYYVKENVPEQLVRYTAPADIRVRIQMWTSAWKVFLDHPFLGVGPMMFDAWHGHHREGLLNRAVYAHCDYLHLLADYGLAGAAAMAALLALLGRRLLLGARKFELLVSLRHPHGEILPDRAAYQRSFYLGVLAGTIGLLAHLLIDFDLHILANALVVSVLLGFAVSLSVSAFEWNSRPAAWPRWVRFPAAALLLLSALALAPLVLRTFYSEIWRDRAAKADKELDWNAADTAFRRALAADPRSSHALADYTEYLYRRTLLGVAQREKWGALFLEACARALEANPLNQNLRVRRGEVLDLLGRPAEAEPEYRAALEFDPDNPFFHNRAGLHYQRRGMTDKATFHFQRVIDLQADEVARENLKELKPL
jgi:O-antigen ligase